MRFFVGGFWGNASINACTTTMSNIDIKTYGNPPNSGNSNPQYFSNLGGQQCEQQGICKSIPNRDPIEGNLNAPMAQLQNMAYPWPGGNSYNPALGNSYNITFSNISLAGTQASNSVIMGWDANNGFHNVTFQNISINGTVVTNANSSSYFNTNAYVWGLNFTP